MKRTSHQNKTFFGRKIKSPLIVTQTATRKAKQPPYKPGEGCGAPIPTGKRVRFADSSATKKSGHIMVQYSDGSLRLS